MKSLDCKGEVNKCKIDIADDKRNEALKKILDKIKKIEKANRRNTSINTTLKFYQHTTPRECAEAINLIPDFEKVNT